MRITSSQLRKIIVEELEAELKESEGLSGDGYRKAITKLRNILEMPGLDQGSQLARRLHDLYSTLTGGSRIAQESLEEAAKEMDRHQKGEKLLQAIGGLKGRSKKDLRAALEKAAKEEGYEETDINDAMGLAGYGKIHSDS